MSQSRLLHHFNRLLPGAEASAAEQIASAVYVTAIASRDPDVSEFTPEWWGALSDEDKAAFLTVVGANVLRTAVRDLSPEEAVIATLRPVASLTPEDQRDIHS